MHLTTVCLIGSARFADTFRLVEEKLTTQGYIVLSKDPNALERRRADGEFDPVELETFHLVHFGKIVSADVVLVIDGAPTFEIDSSHDPYIGESTGRELMWAFMNDKPAISLLSASGWGNIAEMIEHRFDETYFEGHDWLLSHAKQVLRTRTGQTVVTDMVAAGEKQVMQAALSVVASQGDNHVGGFATSVLESLQLDPHEDVMASLSTVPGFTGQIYVDGGKPLGGEGGYVVDNSDEFNQTMTADQLVTTLRKDMVTQIEVLHDCITHLQDKGNRVYVSRRLATMRDRLIQITKG